MRLPLPAGMAFELLAKKRVEADVWPSVGTEAEFEATRAEMLTQISAEKFYEIIASEEYQRVYAANRDALETEQRLRTGTAANIELDYLRWVRWTHKCALHVRFFDTPYPEIKVGYENWYAIPLANHHRLLLVDKEDYDYLKVFFTRMWAGYPCNGGKACHRRVIQRMHPEVTFTREILCDHINGNVSDCRRSNLRMCTRAQNSQNRFRPKTNRSGYKGVSMNRIGTMYNVDITTNGVREYIGQWQCKRDAAIAYNIVAKERCGEFAKLNSVDMTLEDEARVRAAIIAKQPKPPKSSVYYGVSKNGRRWCADLRFQGERYYLGVFDTPELAAAAVDDKLEALGAKRRNNVIL